MNNNHNFNSNEGIGGFEEGLYDDLAVQPTGVNWTRQSYFRLPLKPSLLWKFSKDNEYVTGTQKGNFFSITKDKTIIIPVCDNKTFNGEGKLLEVYEDGTIDVLFHCNRQLEAPVIGAEGLIYVTTYAELDSQGHSLFCLLPNGEVKWEYPINYSAKSCTVIDKSGNIYLFTYGNKIGTLLSLSKEGALNWEYNFNSINWCDPIISKEGIIYVGLNVSQTLCAFNKNGVKLWEKPLGQGLGADFMNIKEDGTIYVSITGTLYALFPDGNIKWKYKPGTSNIYKTPALGKNGKLYLNRTPFLLTSLDNEGNELWNFDIKNFPLQEPIIDGDEKILQLSFMHNNPRNKSWVHVISPEGNMIWNYEIEGNIQSAYIADDNVIYIVANIEYLNQKERWEIHAIGDSR